MAQNGIYRKPPDLDPVIIPMEEQHVPRVKHLWKTRFGAPDGTVENWVSAILEEGKPTEAFVASKGGYVLGFGAATIGGPEYVQDYLPHPDIDFEGWPKTGILHMLCVDGDYEGRGIGSRLVEARLRWLAAEGVDGVLGISWHRRDHRDSRPLFEKFDFEAVSVVDDFYERAFDESHCVDCGGTCKCAATVFIRPFPGETGGKTDTDN